MSATKSTSTWNYRIIKYKDDDGFGLHEVYYTNGTPHSRTKRPTSIGISRAEVITDVKRMLHDAKTRPVLEDFA